MVPTSLSASIGLVPEQEPDNAINQVDDGDILEGEEKDEVFSSHGFVTSLRP